MLSSPAGSTASAEVTTVTQKWPIRNIRFLLMKGKIMLVEDLSLNVILSFIGQHFLR